MVDVDLVRIFLDAAIQRVDEITLGNTTRKVITIDEDLDFTTELKEYFDDPESATGIFHTSPSQTVKILHGYDQEYLQLILTGHPSYHRIVETILGIGSCSLINQDIDVFDNVIVLN